MNKITKNSIASLKFDILNDNNAAELSLTTTENGAAIAAFGNIELTTRDTEASISIRTAKVQIPNKLETGDILAEQLEANVAHIDDLTIGEHVYAADIEADNISLEGNLNFYPKVEGGRANSPIALHNVIYDLESSISELSSQDSKSFNALSVIADLSTPGTVDGHRTGVIQNIASISAERLATTSATVTDLTAVNISGVNSFEAAQVLAAVGAFDNINVSNSVTTGTVNASTAVSTATVTSTTATIPSLTTATLRPVSNDTGIILSGADGYSYLTLNSTGAMVTDTKSVKMVAHTLDGKTAGITMTGDGVTLQENTIIIPNAVSVIHSLMTSTITSDPDYNTLKEEVEQLSADFAAAIEDASYPTLSEIPDTDSAWEAIRLSPDYLPLSKLITSISIDALNTNDNTPLFLSVYVKLSGNSTLQLLGVSDEAVTWTIGEKVTWNFSESFTFPANTEHVEINLIVNKLAPAVVTNSTGIVSKFLTVTIGGNNNSQRYAGTWYSGRATLITFEQKGTLGKLNTKVEEVASNVAALQTEVTDLELTTQSEITALQTDLDRLQEEVDNLEIGGTGTGTLIAGDPISTTLIYGSTLAPEDVQTPQELVLAAEPIFISGGVTDIATLKSKSIVVSTDLLYIAINGQYGSLRDTLSNYTPLSSPNRFPDIWKNIVPTIDQISINMLSGELGALLTRPVKSGWSVGSVTAFENVLPYCTLELKNAGGDIFIDKSSFSFTPSILAPGYSRVYDLELRIKFESGTPKGSILSHDIDYASNCMVNGTPVTGLLYAESLKTYSGTLRIYPDDTWVLFDNYATFY